MSMRFTLIQLEKKKPLVPIQIISPVKKKMNLEKIKNSVAADHLSSSIGKKICDKFEELTLIGVAISPRFHL